jgi:hypothetical protein
MSSEKKRLECNKEMVDQDLSERKISYAEAVVNDNGLDFLEYMMSEGIAEDFAGVPFAKKRESVSNYEIFPMIYMMNIISGEWAVRRTQKILKDEAVLKVMGFTDEEIKNGLTQRGKKNQYGEGYERKSGIMASTTVIDNLARFEYEGLERSFNSYISRVSGKGVVDFGEIYILDSTTVETSRYYPGAKPVRKRNEEGEETGEVVWGFKVFALSSARTLTPVAIHVTTANDADSPMLLEMVKRGVANLGEGKIKIVLADRGFIDGQKMYQMKYDMGIDFVIPAKKNMEIWKCMTGLRGVSKNDIEEWKYGRKGMSGGYLSKGSVSYAQYAAEPAGDHKDRNGAPINAVVVTRWRDMEIAPGKEKVILTSLDTDSATKVIGLYGQRSLIENRNFRELKQAAALSSLPQQTNKNAEKTARIHMLLCVFMLSVFNILVETAYASPAYADEHIPKNIREFRFMKECEKAKMFVLVKHYYYIYDMEEFLMYAGFTFVPRD